MSSNLPKILVTGASGFIGQYFLERIKDEFFIYAISRRPARNHKLTEHPNIKWIIADVAEKSTLDDAAEVMEKFGGIDYIFHLAGYYDFNYDENPEYVRTNVNGTRNVLEMAERFDIKRFIFASSIAACDFPERGERVSEETPPYAQFAYARSKREGEELVKEFSKKFDTTIVRFAAAFSDWCEYGPLYIFLKTWLSKGWKSNILGGKGRSAITYIHVNCLIEMILRVITLSKSFGAYDVFVCSPENPVTHEELFKLSTRYYYGKEKKPFHMPKMIAWFGVLVLDFFGRFIGKRPFERPWMMKYVDKQLYVDAAYTREKLGWRPTERYRIQRRLLFLVENMKSYPYEWQKRNLKMFKFIPVSPNFKIYERLDTLRDDIVKQIIEHLTCEENRERFSSYNKIDKAGLRKDTITLYQFLSVAVRTRDRTSALAYARQIAHIRSKQSFRPREVTSAIRAVGDIVYNNLIQQDDLKNMEQAIYDEISLTFQLMVDEVEGTFEAIRRKAVPILPRPDMRKKAPDE